MTLKSGGRLVLVAVLVFGVVRGFSIVLSAILEPTISRATMSMLSPELKARHSVKRPSIAPRRPSSQGGRGAWETAAGCWPNRPGLATIAPQQEGPGRGVLA